MNYLQQTGPFGLKILGSLQANPHPFIIVHALYVTSMALQASLGIQAQMCSRRLPGLRETFICLRCVSPTVITCDVSPSQHPSGMMPSRACSPQNIPKASALGLQRSSCSTHPRSNSSPQLGLQPKKKLPKASAFGTPHLVIMPLLHSHYIFPPL